MSAEQVLDNEVELRPSEVTQALIALIESGDNVMLVGPPGCGKTSLVGQAAAACGRDLIVSLPSVEDVTEPGGFPWIAADHSHAKKVLFGQAYAAVNAKRPTVWMWEDYGQAFPSVQAAYMQWAWAREVNGYRLPDYVSIVAATNRRTDRAGVSGMLEPVKGRFTLINVATDVEDFCNNLYARGVSEYGLDEDTIVMGSAFIQFMPDLLNAFNPTIDLSNSPTQRNWVAAFKHASKGLPQHIEHALIAGRVGAGAAATYSSFLRARRGLPSLDSIIKDPDHAIIPDELSALWAVSVGLAARCTVGNFAQLAKYAKRLDKAGYGDFAVLLSRDSLRRCPAIQHTKAFLELALSPTGKYMTGRAE